MDFLAETHEYGVAPFETKEEWDNKFRFEDIVIKEKVSFALSGQGGSSASPLSGDLYKVIVKGIKKMEADQNACFRKIGEDYDSSLIFDPFAKRIPLCTKHLEEMRTLIDPLITELHALLEVKLLTIAMRSDYRDVMAFPIH